MSLDSEIREIQITMLVTTIIMIIIAVFTFYNLPPLPDEKPKNRIRISEKIEIISAVKMVGWMALATTNPPAAGTIYITQKVLNQR